MVLFVTVFALTQVVTVERSALEVFREAVEEAYLVVVDIMRTWLGLVEHHRLFNCNKVCKKMKGKKYSDTAIKKLTNVRLRKSSGRR